MPYLQARDTTKNTKSALKIHTIGGDIRPDKSHLQRIHQFLPCVDQKAPIMMITNGKIPLVLLSVYLLLCALLAIHPVDRPTWWAENITVWVILSVIAIMYLRNARFSDASYAMMSILLVMHTVGGHFTFEKVPFGFVTDLFGFERNNYDRFAHVTVGFYAFPIAEWLFRKRSVSNLFLLWTYPVFVVASAAMSYELIEWAYASMSAPEAGANYLGSQGDIWDAQKDMLCDTGGAVFATTLFFLLRRPVLSVR
jgi:putative membrane protein